MMDAVGQGRWVTGGGVHHCRLILMASQRGGASGGPGDYMWGLQNRLTLMASAWMPWSTSCSASFR